VKFILTYYFLSVLLFASDENGSRNKYVDEADQNKVVNPNNESVVFKDFFNGDNTVAGLTSRGWIVLNQDGGGLTAPWFQGKQFSSYEGPDTGYVAANYNGANSSNVIDQWLISPIIRVSGGDTLSFFYRSPNPTPLTSFDDSIYVRLSPSGGATISDFTSNLGRYLVPKDKWTEWSFIFTNDSTIRFAIQYYMVS